MSRWWFAFAAPFLVTACSDPDRCLDRRDAILVSVANASFDGSDCEVTVTAVDGDFAEELWCSSRQGECLCHGKFLRKGKYTVTAVSPDGRMAETTLRVRGNGCRVKTAKAVLVL